MNILIKGMNIPKNCAECKIICDVEKVEKDPYKGRQPNCPILELPPHGRLIDADALIASIKRQTGFLKTMGGDFAAMAEVLEKGILQEIENAPIIIETEEGK